MITTKIKRVATVDPDLLALLGNRDVSQSWAWPGGVAVVSTSPSGITFVASIVDGDRRLQEVTGLFPALRNLGIDTTGFVVSP